MSSPTIRAQSLNRAIDRLDTLGADTDRLLRRFGFSRTHTSNPLRRVSFSQFVDFYEAAADVAGDSHLGLHIGEYTELDHYDTLGYAARCCDTFGDALQTLCRYLRVLEDGSRASVVISAVEARLRYALTDVAARTGRQTVELGLCVFHRWGESLLQSNWPLHSITFSHPASAGAGEYRRIFSCDVEFEQSANELIFPASLLDTPLQSADSGLRAIMEDSLRHVTHSLPGGDVWISNTRQHIIALLGQGEPSLTAVSELLGVSARTLQRRLKERASSFAELLDAIRKELAGSEMRRAQITTGEVAFALGYSDVSAFHHAFRRWYATTPADYRRRG